MAKEKATAKKFKRGEKLTVEKLDLVKKDSGFAFSGIYVGTGESAPFMMKSQDSEEMIEKTLQFTIFKYLPGEGEGRFQVITDKGLEKALLEGLVKEGDMVEIVKLDKIQLKGGRTFNQYDLYKLVAE